MREKELGVVPCSGLHPLGGNPGTSGVAMNCLVLPLPTCRQCSLLSLSVSLSSVIHRAAYQTRFTMQARPHSLSFDSATYLSGNLPTAALHHSFHLPPLDSPGTRIASLNNGVGGPSSPGTPGGTFETALRTTTKKRTPGDAELDPFNFDVGRRAVSPETAFKMPALSRSQDSYEEEDDLQGSRLKQRSPSGPQSLTSE